VYIYTEQIAAINACIRPGQQTQPKQRTLTARYVKIKSAIGPQKNLLAWISKKQL